MIPNQNDTIAEPVLALRYRTPWRATPSVTSVLTGIVAYFVATVGSASLMLSVFVAEIRLIVAAFDGIVIVVTPVFSTVAGDTTGVPLTSTVIIPEPL
jgi:hypothetical protein